MLGKILIKNKKKHHHHRPLNGGSIRRREQEEQSSPNNGECRVQTAAFMVYVVLMKGNELDEHC